MMSLSRAALQKAMPSIWESKNGGEATKSTSGKSWMLAAPRKQKQPQTSDFDPGTDSDDPDNLPKPIVVKHPLGVNGNPEHHSEPTGQSPEVQPPATTVANADLFDDDGHPMRFGDPPAPWVPPQAGVWPWSAQAFGAHVPTPYPAKLVMDPYQAAAEAAHSPFLPPIDPALTAAILAEAPTTIDPALAAAILAAAPTTSLPIDPALTAASPAAAQTTSLPIDPALTAAPPAPTSTPSLPIDPALTAAPQLPAPAPTPADNGQPAAGDNNSDHWLLAYFKYPDESEPDNVTSGSHGA